MSVSGTIQPIAKKASKSPIGIAVNWKCKKKKKWIKARMKTSGITVCAEI